MQVSDAIATMNPSEGSQFVMMSFEASNGEISEDVSINTTSITFEQFVLFEALQFLTRNCQSNIIITL